MSECKSWNDTLLPFIFSIFTILKYAPGRKMFLFEKLFSFLPTKIPQLILYDTKIMKSFTIIKDKLATVVNWHFSVIVKNVMQLLSHEDF